VTDSEAGGLAFGHAPSLLWRNFCDQLYRQRFGAWLGHRNFHRALKTDLYDESVTAGLVPWLQERCDSVEGIDVLTLVVQRAAARYPQLRAQVGDVRQLPFPDRHFDLVVSNSTLDHFEKLDDLLLSLRQLYRVLDSGGLLLVTLDNAAHPLIWLRRQLALRLGSPLPLVPYYPGHTLTLGGLAAELRACGFAVEKVGWWFHAPRVLAVQACAWLDRCPAGWGRWLCRLLAASEIAEKLPTAPVTGHYVAVMARRP
jgi:SAM-dependent methyltransferase